MNPRLKRIIVIANIAVYVVVCLGIYAKRKGGFKAAFLPRKKASLDEVIAKKRQEMPVPAAPGAKAPVVAKTPAVAEKKVVPAPPKPLPVKPTPSEIASAALPAHIKDAKKLLENMRIKEEMLKFNYRSSSRDPFVSLSDIDNYLSQAKFTPDDYADLPPGLPTKAKQKSSPFTLSGTIKSKDGESSAIINSQVLREGDIIDGYKLTKIEKKGVTLVSGKKVIKLKMVEDEVESETNILKRLEEAK